MTDRWIQINIPEEVTQLLEETLTSSGAITYCKLSKCLYLLTHRYLACVYVDTEDCDITMDRSV